MSIIQFVFVYAGLLVQLPSAAAAVTAPPTAIVPSRALNVGPECELRLVAAQETLDGLLRRGRARWGRAYLGTFDELETLLRRAGVARTRIDQYLYHLDQMLAVDLPDASFKDLSTLFTRMTARKSLSTCVLTAECSLSVNSRTRAAFSLDQRHGVMLIPLPTQPAPEFAVDFLSALSSLAAEDLLTRWLDALSPRLEPGDFDAFAHRPHFDLIFKSLYKLHQRLELEALALPDAKERRDRAIAATVNDLVNGNDEDVNQLMRELGLTRLTILRTTVHLIDDMRGTLIRARKLAERE